MIQREIYMEQIRAFIDKPVIKAITGMRRSGKSVLLGFLHEELLSRGIPEERIFTINFESLQYEHLKDYRKLYQTISEKAESEAGKLYLCIDEIQEVESWEKVITSVRVDFDCDVYITGSNSKLLSGELSSLLSGRYVEIIVYPLSFSEYLLFAETNAGEQGLSTTDHFANYLRFGGLPGIHEMNWEESSLLRYLSDMYSSIILKDVVKRHSIRDIDLLERIIHYLMDNIGSTFSAKNIADFLKSQRRKLSTETVYTYIKALSNSCFIHAVPRYDIKGKKLLETQEKLFLADLGLRHAALGYREQDIAGLLENVVFLELLRRGWSVRIGKLPHAEVDFVAVREDERLYVQVAYILHEGNIEREFSPLEQIPDNYEKVVLSTDTLLRINRNGIRQRNIIDFLLDDERA